MHLSPIYQNKFKWVMVYHTSPDSEEVEMFHGNHLFSSESEAWAWFHANYRIHHFVQPEAVHYRLSDGKLFRVESLPGADLRHDDYEDLARAEIKQISRGQDAKDLAEGKKTAEQLRQENGKFAFPNATIDWSGTYSKEK